VLLLPLVGEERVEDLREFTGEDMAETLPPPRRFDALPPSGADLSRNWDDGVDGAERDADERPVAGVETALPRPLLTGVPGLWAGSESLLQELKTSSSEPEVRGVSYP
jgi:hypothetical protein